MSHCLPPMPGRSLLLLTGACISSAVLAIPTVVTATAALVRAISGSRVTSESGSGTTGVSATTCFAVPDQIAIELVTPSVTARRGITRWAAKLPECLPLALCQTNHQKHHYDRNCDRYPCLHVTILSSFGFYPAAKMPKKTCASFSHSKIKLLRLCSPSK